MPRDLPISNGSLLVAFDQNYQIRDLYWPHVGQENHTLGHAFRLGVWVSGEFRWLDDERWQRSLKYQPGTMITDVYLHHPDLEVEIQVADGIDFHENLHIRRFDITNDANQDREVRLFFHHDFHIGGNEVGDTAYYEPDRRAVVHYKGARWFLINGAVALNSNDTGPTWIAKEDTMAGLMVGVHQWACGLKEIHEMQGTWRDAEDGQLSGNAVAHGSVDSTVGFSLNIPAKSRRTLYYWMAAGENFDSVATINRLVRQRGPEAYLNRARAFWRLWLTTHLPDLAGLPEDIRQEYELSLFIIRTQVDNSGAIIAANDSDISSSIRDTYSYMWPRDGAIVADALNQAGYLDLPRAFFQFCQRALAHEGYLLHKYNPDGTLASSWLPWYLDGKKDIPIQEDETALVLWALWRHFERHGDVYFIKPLYKEMICSMADFLVAYRDPATGLPLPSYDLWEERRGVFAWTLGAVWGGLEAAANFAEAFGETSRAEGYRRAAAQIKAGVDACLWQPDLGYFARMINHHPGKAWEIDKTIDASIIGLWQFGMYASTDPKVVAAMTMIHEQLWVKTHIGGIARYENDAFHQVSQDLQNIPGNPWFICTLWMADWIAQTANSDTDLVKALELLEWAVQRASPSGVLAEQVNPFTGVPESVSPLTWSHAAFIVAVQAYLAAQARLHR